MKILLADDHALVREGFKQVLQCIESRYMEIREVSNYSQVFEVLQANNTIDLIVLDPGMPGMLQLEGVQKIRTDYPTIPLILLSATENPGIIKKAMGYGVSGYLLKSSSNEVMANALRLILAGGIYLPHVLLNNRRQDSSMPWTVTSAKNEFKVLTERQREIVNHMCEGKSNKQIARLLNITERTVKSHLTLVFQTLRVSNRREAMQQAMERNLVGEG